MYQPFYDPVRTYQQNYDQGPFGPFAEQPSSSDKAALDMPRSSWVHVGGLLLRRPIGIPAGPLLNSRYVGAAFSWGYDLAHYKTVRSREWPAHPSPNVLHVDAAKAIPPAEIGRVALRARPFGRDEEVDVTTLSITNSFGMPAQPPDVWQADMESAARGAGSGQAMVASVYGTPAPDGDHRAYVADFARTAAMCRETGAHAIEVNLSCPNVGGYGLLCHNPEAAERVCRAVREAIGSTVPLFVKLGSFTLDQAGQTTLSEVIEATARIAQGYGAVNAVPVPIITAGGEAALPGEGRGLAGVCGAALKATGLDLVARLAKLRADHGYEFAIIGVGGFAAPADYDTYREAGADAVQGATGPMWNYRLAVEVALAGKLHGIVASLG